MRASLVIACCLLVTLCVFSGVAASADNPGLANFSPDETDAAPGETVEINSTIQVISTNDDEAVESIAYTIVYDPEVLSVEAVEQGPWLRGGETTTVSFDTDIDADAGELRIDQVREPPVGGVIGDGTTATITFSIAEDAPPSSAVIRYESYSAQMLEYPLPIHRPSAMGTTIHVDGGGEERDPLATEGDTDTPEIITPESESESATGTESNGERNEPVPADEEPAESDIDDQSGFGVIAAIFALGAFVLARVTQSV